MKNIIFQTSVLRLEHEFEYAQLVEISTGEILLEDDFYGDPTCGLISDQNDWAIVAGEHVTIWTPTFFKKFTTREIQWIHSLRLKNRETVEILIDPWHPNSAIWEINIPTCTLTKIRDFDDYKNRELTDEILW